MGIAIALQSSRLLCGEDEGSNSAPPSGWFEPAQPQVIARTHQSVFVQTYRLLLAECAPFPQVIYLKYYHNRHLMNWLQLLNLLRS